jgi:hypothetical protein
MTGLFDRDGHVTDLAASRRVAGELDAGEQARLSEHLSGCDACRARLDALAHVAAAPLPPLRLTGRVVPAAPGRPTLRVLSGGAPRMRDPAPAPAAHPPEPEPTTEEAAPAPAVAVAPPPPAPRPVGRGRFAAFLAAGLALAAGVALALRVPAGPEEDDTFTARGGGGRLQLFRDAPTGAEALTDGATVAGGERFGARLTGIGPDEQVVLVGIDARGGVWPIWPTNPAAGTATTVGSALQAGFQLDDAPGVEHILAVGCAARLDAEALTEGLHRAPRTAERLPELFPGCTQDEVRLVKPGGSP